jgi:aminoglycoside phosphotransferase (APT) family kinase protein
VTQKLHPGEPDLSVSLVQRLLAAQFPHWAVLHVEPVDSAGTDHVLYRLGPALVVRLPRIDWAREQVAVIDFGCLGVGDPAVDLIVAWNFLPSDARAAFRAALGVDDTTWARGRGWALYTGLVALPYYQNSNPRLASLARRTLQVVLEEEEGG